MKDKASKMRNSVVEERLSDILDIVKDNLVRRRGRMTNINLAKESGVNKGLIEKLDKGGEGKANPTLKSLVKLATFFDMGIVDFLAGGETCQTTTQENRHVIENLITGQFLNLKFELMKFCEEMIEKKIKS